MPYSLVLLFFVSRAQDYMGRRSRDRAHLPSRALALHRKQASEEHTLAFTIPVIEPVPPQYYVRAFSERWVGCVPPRANGSRARSVSCDVYVRIQVRGHVRDFDAPLRAARSAAAEYASPRPHAVAQSALAHKARTPPSLARCAQSRSPPGVRAAVRGPYKFEHFNPIQTQLFHTLYHTDRNVLSARRPVRGRRSSPARAMRLRTQPGAKAAHRTAQGEARARAMPRARALHTHRVTPVAPGARTRAAA